MHRYALIMLLLVAARAVPAWALGLETAVAVDIVGQAGLGSNAAVSNALSIRGAEIMLLSPADHLFEGVLSFAAHGEGAVVNGVEVHEAYVGSTKLIPRSRFRVGQFFLGFGRLNQFHQHDWPFISAPKVHETFFAKEGILDTGLEYSYLAPLPFYLEATLGMTNGFVFGHSHNKAPPRPLFPTYYGRLLTYVPLPWEGGSQLGLSHIGRRSEASEGMSILGLDYTAKWRGDKEVKLFFQSELWYRVLTPRNTEAKKALGFYLYPQYHLGEGFFLGLRFDYYSELNKKDAIGRDIKSVEMNIVPTLTWKPSEFVQMRLAYNERPQIDGASTDTRRYFELQSIFILGAHPAHDF